MKTRIDLYSVHITHYLRWISHHKLNGKIGFSSNNKKIFNTTIISHMTVYQKNAKSGVSNYSMAHKISS